MAGREDTTDWNTILRFFSVPRRFLVWKTLWSRAHRMHLARARPRETATSHTHPSGLCPPPRTDTLKKVNNI